MKYISVAIILAFIGFVGCNTKSSPIEIEGVSLTYPAKEYRFRFDYPKVFSKEGVQWACVDGVVTGSEAELSRDNAIGNNFYRRIIQYPFQAEVLDQTGKVVETGKASIIRYRISTRNEAECKLCYKVVTPLHTGYTVRFTSLQKW